MTRTCRRRILIPFFAVVLLAAPAIPSCSQEKGKTALPAADNPKETTPPQKADRGGIVPAHFAGSWYPGGGTELEGMIDGFLAGAKKHDVQGRLIALIAPHAGYVYSGSVAAHAFKQLEGAAFETVVVVGFAHRFPFDDISVYAEGHFETPLGLIPVDTELARALIDQHPSIRFYREPFLSDRAPEHSIENELPFLQRVLGAFKLVPVMIGGQSPGNVEILASALARVLKGRNALMVASTDLAHFWTHEETARLDAETAKYVEKMDADGLRKLLAGDATGRRMCGHGAAEAVMRAAAALGADRGVILKTADSYDITGESRERVVGYLAAAFFDTSQKKAKGTMEMKNEDLSAGELNEAQKKELLLIARESLENYVRTGEKRKFPTGDEGLKAMRGMFVTLNKHGRLRGCMGHFEQDVPLNELAAHQVIVSATRDPRFTPVRPDELEDITIEISVLSSPEPVASYEDIIVGKHGVILEKGASGATFLPQVAPEQGWDRDTMLEHLAMKAGLPPDGWKKGASFQVYTAQVFGEED
ncbi:MAG: AmmeMemoRadiSam system protein B [bacterium]